MLEWMFESKVSFFMHTRLFFQQQWFYCFVQLQDMYRVGYVCLYRVYMYECVFFWCMYKYVCIYACVCVYASGDGRKQATRESTRTYSPYLLTFCIDVNSSYHDIQPVKMGRWKIRKQYNNSEKLVSSGNWIYSRLALWFLIQLPTLGRVDSLTTNNSNTNW